MTLKILLTGASGSLGSSIIKKKFKNIIILGISFKQRKNNLKNCDLTEKKELFSLLNNYKPDVIIHSAAMTDINLCENNKSDCRKINIGITKNICKWISSFSKKTKLIFISSDQLYGNKCKKNREYQSDPMNFYAISKEKSENIVSKLTNTLILRVNFVGKGTIKKKSFTDWASLTFKSRKQYSYYDNIFFNPLTANQLAEIIFKCIAKNLKGKYNIGSKNYISKANFIIKFSKKIGIFNKNYKIENYVHDGINAIRPYNTAMNVNKIEKYFSMPTLNKVLNDLKKDYI